jgi:uncharacterized protein
VAAIDRRTFVKAGALSAAGLVLKGFAADAPAAAGAAVTMKYRTLGRTGLSVSEIGMGGSPAPAAAVFGFCYRNGVNWFDTSSGYDGGASEKSYGEYLTKTERSKMVVCTKMHVKANTTKQEILDEVAGSLQRLGVQQIDVLHIHGLGSLDQLNNPAAVEACDELKKRGSIRFTGVSVHGNTLELLPKVIEKNYHDVLLVGFNVYRNVGEKYDDALGTYGLVKVLEDAAKKNIGVLAMKVQAGGNNQKLDRFLKDGVTAGQAKIMWALSHPFLSGVVTEMESVDMASENCRAPQMRLSADLREDLRRYCSHDSAEYCRMCGVCTGVCPSGVAIQDIQRFVRYRTRYTDARNASAAAAYRDLPVSRNAAACTGCGACEQACPWGVAVRDNLHLAERLFA